ncbi:hypothetical protein [Fodinicola feengrottensis]|uniref:hypothetical protein n=1 Tax=Fodinicola feengrottensis TaxID=435914 RepID=UPI00244327EF|nr:hypothetical protein [Fodinicola feengrottensis]
MARTRRNLVFVLATAAAAGLVVQAPATAGHVHVIQTANSPSTGQPVLGGGSWIVNKPSGYYVGRAMAGSVFDDEVTSSGNWHFGRASTTVDMCGWVMPGSLGGSLGDTADTCSTTTQNAISHRRTVGKDYNQPAHATGDGTAAAANTGCVVQFTTTSSAPTTARTAATGRTRPATPRALSSTGSPPTTAPRWSSATRTWAGDSCRSAASSAADRPLQRQRLRRSHALFSSSRNVFRHRRPATDRQCRGERRPTRF